MPNAEKKAAKTLVDKLMFTWQGLTWNMNFTGFMWDIAVHVNLRIDYLQIEIFLKKRVSVLELTLCF